MVNKHAPTKYEYVMANHGPFMKKELRKAILTGSKKLENIFFRDKTIDTHLNYKRQRNLCTNLVRKAKKSYYNSEIILNYSY